jgi:mono/diheme cytochrome c family protein
MSDSTESSWNLTPSMMFFAGYTQHQKHKRHCTACHIVRGEFTPKDGKTLIVVVCEKHKKYYYTEKSVSQ